MHQTSPGVERAVEAAERWRAKLNAPQLRLADLLLGLLDEEDGRPAVLVKSLGQSPTELQRIVADWPIDRSPPAPPLAKLLDVTRNWSLAHRADPTCTTDAFLIAVLRADPAFTRAVAELGLDSDRLERSLVPAGSGPVDPPSAPVGFAFLDRADDVNAARILDANLNRARESLRVVEDYGRFGLNDRFLTEQIKELRHELAALTALLPKDLLLAARNTTGDVGTTVSAAGEYDRGSAFHVAAVNWKRLQESLRSLEEYGKLFGPDFARGVERLRYRAYTLERAVLRGSTARERLANARLYVLLTAAHCTASLEWVIERAAAGGAEVFQLREKSLTDRELLARARDVRKWTRTANALFIMNDRPDIAKLVEADGVHLGQDDLPAHDARRIVGPDLLVGVSTHHIEQVRRAILDGADYIGVGPTFPSQTKAFNEFAGLTFIHQVTAETSLPAFALGGIGPNNIAEVVAAGATRIAVSGAIAQADDPEPIARQLRNALGG